MDIIIGIIILILFGGEIAFGAFFFVAGLAYAYWGLSIGMAPVVWILLIIGLIIGFVIAIKNAILAVIQVYGRRAKE